VNYPIPPPTILFIKPGNLVSTHSEILTKAKKSSLLYSLAWRQKMAGITEGFITKDSLWDRLVFNGARAHTLGDIAATLKAVIVSEGMYPFISLLSHPLTPIQALSRRTS
jgi:long-chain acyl-CoA synthetase